MKPICLFRLLLTSLLVWSSTCLAAPDEQELIATLQSGATAPQKWAACQRLRLIGTAKAVPALAALLTQEGLSQAARYALEALPGPEADQALRQALGTTSGLLKAGMIDSIGWRGRTQSVPVLSPLLSDPDSTIASAAASALGRIGGRQALAALSAERDRVADTVQPTLLEALLKCAERLAPGKAPASVLRVYRNLDNPNYPIQIRTAAWRDLVLADSGQRAGLILKALQGNDHPRQAVALKLVRELKDRQVIQAGLAQWSGLSAAAQMAVLDAQVTLGAEALPTARRAAQSSDLRLRVAAWEALGQLNDTSSILALAKAAAQGEATEQEAARESLERLHGPAANAAMLAQAAAAPAAEKAELLRALGERGDPAAADALLSNARSDLKPVRVAALDALSHLAPPSAAAPLLEMAAQTTSDEDRGPVLAALYAVCEASADREGTSRKLVEMLQHFPAAERRPLLPVLAELGTADALGAAEATSRNSDLELAKEGVRVLSQWPNAAAAGSLLELARSATDPALQTLALRGAIQVAGQEPDASKRLALLQQAMAGAKHVEEKRLVLGQLGQMATPAALELALQDLAEPDLTGEASLASLTIAEKLAPSQPDLADHAASQVLAHVQQGEVASRAWSLRRKPAINAPFIRYWLVSGPYRRAGVAGAKAIFDIPFGPENSGTAVSWTSVPPSDHVNLGALFPGEGNCAAYLRTRVIAPEDCQALLLMGSDDGIKAWVDGKVVHSNNVDRGDVADQDIAPIHLTKGNNDLLLKITQGGGGWSACARIVDPQFQPIDGLQFECPEGRQ